MRVEEGQEAGAGVPAEVEKEQVRKAVVALLKWAKSQRQANKQQLLEEDEMFYVVFGLKKIPESGRTNGRRIPLPHSLYPLDSGREVCLIVKDNKTEGGHKYAKEKLMKEENTGVTKVLGIQKLRTKFKPFEAKRQLCGSYDLFLADDRVIPVLPKLLGKSFFKKKKHPIPVKLQGGQWAKKIRSACDSTYLYLGDGPCCVVRAARLSQTEDEIMENILQVISGAVSKIPRKWKNIQSIYVKLQESASLPVFVSLPSVPTKVSV